MKHDTTRNGGAASSAHGITSLKDLSVYTQDDVHNIFKQLQTTQIVEVRTLALTRYAAHLAESGQILDPVMVTEQLLVAETVRSRKRASEDDDESRIKQPGDFTDAAKWKMWNELFQNHLCCLRHCYMSYVLDPVMVTEQLLAAETVRSRKRASKDDDESRIKQPGDFTDAAKWKMWNELFQNYLCCLLNRYHAPLLYVLRVDEAPLLDPLNIAALPTAHE
jgi:hypothetical protein